MPKEQKQIGPRFPIEFYQQLEEYISTTAHSMASYAQEAVYEKFNRERMYGNLGRCPTAIFKDILKQSQQGGNDKLL